MNSSEQSGLNAAIERIQQLDEGLRADVEYWVKQFELGNRDQLARRSFVRSVFALIEGIVFCLKQVTLETATTKAATLSPQEIALLREESAELQENGELASRPAFLRLKPNLRFSFRKFAEIYKAQYRLDVSQAGWEKLGPGIRIRDRLMHPKTPQDISVSDDELAIVKTAYEWFNKTYVGLFDAVMHVIDSRNKSLEETLTRLERQLQEERARADGGRKDGA